MPRVVPHLRMFFALWISKQSPLLSMSPTHTKPLVAATMHLPVTLRSFTLFLLLPGSSVLPEIGDHQSARMLGGPRPPKRNSACVSRDRNGILPKLGAECDPKPHRRPWRSIPRIVRLLSSRYPACCSFLLPGGVIATGNCCPVSWGRRRFNTRSFRLLAY
jgi:hypothetical protein